MATAILNISYILPQVIYLFVKLQWEAKVQRCQKEFEEISSEIKGEMERFELNRSRDLKSTVVKYLEDQMAHQQQVILHIIV